MMIDLSTVNSVKNAMMLLTLSECALSHLGLKKIKS